MARKARPHRLMVKLTDMEHEALQARAHADGVPMAAVLRAGIGQAQAPERPAPALSRTWVLERLAAMAADGQVAATIALERALRLGGVEAPSRPGPVSLDALDALDEPRTLRVLR